MPVRSGLNVAEELMKKGCVSKVIILTTFARPGYFERAVKAGAHGAMCTGLYGAFKISGASKGG